MGKNLGITEVQGRILDFILVDGRDRPLYQKDIEKEFGLRPSTATELLKTLESRKMIQRVSSEEDGGGGHPDGAAAGDPEDGGTAH